MSKVGRRYHVQAVLNEEERRALQFIATVEETSVSKLLRRLIRKEAESMGLIEVDLPIDSAAAEALEDPAKLDAILEREQLRKDVHVVLNRMTPRERQVISLRFGLADGKALTLEETACAIGYCTRERVRQIEARALHRLRHPVNSRQLFWDYVSTSFPPKKEKKAIVKEPARLNSREIRILRARYGIGEPIATLGHLANKFGISSPRVREIEIRALEKLVESGQLKDMYESYIERTYHLPEELYRAIGSSEEKRNEGGRKTVKASKDTDDIFELLGIERDEEDE